MAPTTTTIPTKRALPPKEASLFRELLQFYESRLLKKGIKTADQILKKYPEHGETLCMKGLVLTHMGKREEGRELVKKGMRFDLTSHIVWHVFGLIQKGEKNYEEALKSYTQALRFDKENMNILRDAAHLQAQLRMYDSLVETRHLLLKLRPNLRQNWIGLAVAYHLSGNLVEARKVLEQYERTLKNVPDYDIEQSELLLYHVRILEEMGEYSEALRLLDVNAKERVILDRVAVMEMRARLLSALGPAEEAEQSWRSLIQQNPDCPDYYKGLLRTKYIELDSISPSDRANALEILRELSLEVPRASSPRRLALTISSDADFKSLVSEHLVHGLTKGIPSLFTDTKSLYQDPSKRTVIEEIVEGFRETLQAGGTIGDASAQTDEAARKAVSPEEPTTYLWTLYFLAQHYSYLGLQTRALPIVATALTHTPTLPELYTLKGRILKRLGDLRRAANAVEDARSLDGQDRFLNTKTAKYRLRAGQIAEADNLFGMFTKKDASSPGADLEDMQSLLYLTEEGQAYLRTGKPNLALKKFHAVQKVFDEMEDDQFDFHGYSMRKFTVNIYINMIHWADQLRSHPAYVSSALSASRIYVRIHDDPSLLKEDTDSGALTEAQKKAKKKAKKAAQKVQAVDKKGAASANEDKGLEVTPAKDEDPDGMKLLTDPQPLERAWKFLAPLTTICKTSIDVWIAVYDVSVRRGKYLQAIKALHTIHKLDASHPELHPRLLHFRKTYTAPAEGPAGPIVSEAFEALLPAQFASEAFNAQYLQQHGNSARAILGAARGQQVLGASPEALEGTLFSVLNEGVEIDIPTGLAVWEMLKEIRSTRSEEFRKACDARFELSTVFKTPEELELALKEGVPPEEQTEIMT